jgi:hypothetical protein
MPTIFGILDCKLFGMCGHYFGGLVRGLTRNADGSMAKVPDITDPKPF